MKSKEEVKKLIGLIKTATGYTQQEISVKAGYAERSITQILSSGEGLDSLYKQLELVFGERLRKPTQPGSKPQPAPVQQPETITLRQHCEIIEKHYNDMLQTKNELMANYKALNNSHERLAQSFATMTALLTEIKEVKRNLADAAAKQQTFRVMTGANQRVMLETLADLKGLTDIQTYVNSARNLGTALLGLNDKEDRNHSETSDSLSK